MATIANGIETTRRDAFQMLNDGVIDFFLTTRSGQITAEAHALQVHYTSKKDGASGMIRIQRGESLARKRGLEAVTSNPVGTLTHGEKKELKRLLTKLLKALD